MFWNKQTKTETNKDSDVKKLQTDVNKDTDQKVIGHGVDNELKTNKNYQQFEEEFKKHLNISETPSFLTSMMLSTLPLILIFGIIMCIVKTIWYFFSYIINFFYLFARYRMTMYQRIANITSIEVAWEITQDIITGILILSLFINLIQYLFIYSRIFVLWVW